MAAVVRADKFSSDSATIHDIDFPSGTTTAGNLVAMLLDTAGTISSVTARGASGTVSLEDDAPDYAGFGNSGYVYTLPEADAAITGLRVTLTGDSPIAGQLLEIEDSDGIDGVIGVRTGTFNAAGTRVSITTTEDNSIGAGFVFTSGGGGTFTPDSNNTDVESDTTSASFYTGSLSTAGAKTIGGVMSSATFCYGFGVAFRHADSGGSASTITAAAGVATASSMAGSSTASTAITGASGAATASTMAGSGQAIASFTAAAGAATASSRTGSSTATGSTTQASGAATASSMAGSSTASAAFTAATGAATAATMSSDAGAATITQASGVATTSAMAGSSTVVAAFVSASGTATTATLAGPTPAADATGGWFLPIRRKKRRQEPEEAPAAPIGIEAEQKRLEDKRALRKAEAKDRQVMSELRRIYAEQDALTRAISDRQADIARQIEDDEEVAILLALAS